MSKTLPLSLSQHPLLIKAFTGEDGKFTTEKCYAENHNPSPNGIECIPTKWLASTPKTWVGIAPAPDLEELLDLAVELLGSRAQTELEKELMRICECILIPILFKEDRLTRLYNAIIAVQEERQ